ncbi:hypothetical protein G6F22_020839 [Rhizopus arrhizus]|nr:hypothetical protein G6F22_020839 [Rhizopus arrhizus]
MAFEASQSLAYERLEHASQLSPKIQAVLEAGSQITAEEHIKNLARAEESRARVNSWRPAVLARLDLVRPALLEPAVRDGAPGPARGAAGGRATLR